MPNSLTSIIHNKIPANFQGSWGKMENDPIKKLLKNLKQQPSKLEKGYSQDLFKKTVVSWSSVWTWRGQCRANNVDVRPSPI